MEFILISLGEVEFNGASFIPENEEEKNESLTRINYTRRRLTLGPKINGLGCDMYADGGGKSFREKSIDLLFGHSGLAKDLKMGSNVPVTTHLTLTSSNTGRLKIETKRATLIKKHLYDVDLWMTPEEDKPADIIEQLYTLQEDLPPNSIEFILSLDGFQKCLERMLSFEEGLKIKRYEDGSAILEMTNINFPEDVWWKEWSEKRAWFDGDVAIKVRLNMAAVTELYKKHFGGDPLSAIALGTPADMVIFAGGNQDKEKAIKCHKAILSEMSPVFAAMFQADMLEAKESSLEIVDFSEAVIRALIEFAYRRNVEEALKSSELALELLQVAHKYQIKNLMDILLYMIWSMPCTWFSADVVIKLFFFTKNVGKDLAEAEKKCWVVLKWYAKKYPEKLVESKEGVRLCENPRAVMELFVQLLSEMK